MSLVDTEHLFIEATEKLALLIQYASAESTAEHTCISGFESEAFHHMERELIDVHRAVKGIYGEIETMNARIRELTAENAALTGATTKRGAR